eukprot:11416586-Ditylum_brightwellii.AAC.1
MSCSPERTTTPYQTGGTATFITDKWMSQVCDSGRDKLGRWSYITIKGTKLESHCYLSIPSM